MTTRKYVKINLGIRAFLAGILMLSGQFAMAALCFLAPIHIPVSQILGVIPEEMKAAHDELIGKVKQLAKDEVLAHVKAMNEDGEKKINDIVDKKVEAFKDLPVTELKKIVTDMVEINKTVADLKAKAADANAGPKEKLLKKALKENWPLMHKNFENGSSTYKFTLEEKNISASSFGDRVVFGFREAGVDFEQLPEAFILDFIQVMNGGPGSNPLSWIERNKVVDAGPPEFVTEPTTVAEGNKKPSMKYAWVERKMSSSTVAVLVPVTKQAVYNYAMLEQEVRFELLRQLANVLQKKIFKGAGTGTGDDVKGLFTYAQPFVAGDFAASIPFANEFDVLVAAATQVLNRNFVPSLAVLTHTTKGKMSTAKGVDGHYVLPPFVVLGGALQVYGMSIKSTNALEGDEFLVMDPTRALWNWVENPQIEIGMINDDFEKNIWRLRAELQGMLRVKEHEKYAFVKGDFSVAAADITL